jgi:hypothetical protein
MLQQNVEFWEFVQQLISNVEINVSPRPDYVASCLTLSGVCIHGDPPALDNAAY